jgi:predicted ATP-dependent serine protease
MFKINLDDEWVVECNVCGARYRNWAGSTPCCGSLAFVVDIKMEEREKKIKKLLENIKK